MVDAPVAILLDWAVNRARHITATVQDGRSGSRPGAIPARMKTGGSILAEIVLGLAILILASWLVIDLVGAAQQRRRRDAFIVELRGLANVFQGQGEALANASGDAALPPVVSEALKSTAWFKGPVCGGDYEWIPAPATTGGADSPRRDFGTIAVTAFAPRPRLTLSRADWLYIDRVLDDGNLETGRFRAGFNGWPHYLIGPAK